MTGRHEATRWQNRQPRECREYLAALTALLETIDYCLYPDARERLHIVLTSLDRVLDSDDVLLLSAEATVLRAVTGG